MTKSRTLIRGIDSITNTDHVLVLDDCRNVMDQMPDQSVTLTHTSPPYNIGRKYSGFRDKQDIDRYTDLIREVAERLYRITSPGGSVFWQVGYTAIGKGPSNESAGITLLDALSLPIFEDAGFRLWDRVIWNYYGSMAFKSKFTNRHETILWLTKPISDKGVSPLFQLDEIREKSKSYDGRNHLYGRNPGNVWYSERVAFGSSGQTSHIAVFPEEVSEKIVRSCSKQGDLVFDPFSGSGTLPKVAYSLSRRVVGAEITETYIQEADKRLRLWADSETENLAVGLLVKYGFHRQTDVKSLRYLSDVLGIHVLDKATNADLRILHADVDEILNASRVTPAIKRQKRDMWERYDEIIKHRDESDATIAADRSLAFCYAHRRQWNGVRRYLTAGKLLEDLREQIDSTGGPESFIRQLCKKANSRFRLERRSVECLSTDAGLGCNGQISGSETRPDNKQGLLLPC